VKQRDQVSLKDAGESIILQLYQRFNVKFQFDPAIGGRSCRVRLKSLV
jgi:hypothetical protein